MGKFLRVFCSFAAIAGILIAVSAKDAQAQGIGVVLALMFGFFFLLLLVKRVF
ncbi:MAG: hypothetical protein RLY20_2252 [Verrucomicrobiota bacterium]|jgi:hypothetical protein